MWKGEKRYLRKSVSYRKIFNEYLWKIWWFNMLLTVRCMMFGFGDDQNPYTESVELLEDLVVEFISEMVTDLCSSSFFWLCYFGNSCKLLYIIPYYG